MTFFHLHITCVCYYFTILKVKDHVHGTDVLSAGSIKKCNHLFELDELIYKFAEQFISETLPHFRNISPEKNVKF